MTPPKPSPDRVSFQSEYKQRFSTFIITLELSSKLCWKVFYAEHYQQQRATTSWVVCWLGWCAVSCMAACGGSEFGGTRQWNTQQTMAIPAKKISSYAICNIFLNSFFSIVLVNFEDFWI